MVLKAEKKSAIISEYRRGDSDTGSPEVQVALVVRTDHAAFRALRRRTRKIIIPAAVC